MGRHSHHERSGLVERSRALRMLVPLAPETSPGSVRRVYLLVWFTLRRFFVEDRGLGMAASLTLQALLSTVPVLGIAFSLAALLDPDTSTALFERVLTPFVPAPVRGDLIASRLMPYVHNITFQRLGAVGFGATLVLAFALFATLERSFNTIWRATTKRPLVVRFTLFYTLLTLSPVLLLYSLAVPLLRSFEATLTLPLVTSSLGFTLLYRFLPHVRVRMVPALCAGIATGLSFEVGKLVFAQWVLRMSLQTYASIYESLATVPLLILWTYGSWATVLLGCEVAFVIQRRRLIALSGYMNPYHLPRSSLPWPSAPTCLHMLVEVCRQHEQGHQGMTADALAETFGLPLEIVVAALTQLERLDLVTQVRTTELFMPSRPASSMKIVDVLTAFEDGHALHAHTPSLLQQLASARRTFLGERTLADLLREDAPSA